MKKAKSAQNTAPVHRLRRSPGWKNRSRFFLMHFFSHCFFNQNRRKSQPERQKNEFRETNRLKIASWCPFECQGSIFRRFWGPGGNPRIAKKLQECRKNGVWGALVQKNPLKIAPGPHFSKFWHQIWHWQGSKFKKTSPGGMQTLGHKNVKISLF